MSHVLKTSREELDKVLQSLRDQYSVFVCTECNGFHLRVDEREETVCKRCRRELDDGK